MIKIFRGIYQGTEEWLEARRGLLTASEMKLIITPNTLKVANNNDTRVHMFELIAQRISGFVEPSYTGGHMIRGKEEEVEARNAYSTHYAKVEQVGFITNDKWDFTLGYSPDGLVEEDGQIEVKSKCQKLQIQTILSKEMPAENILQVQTGLLVSERKWCDFISYCGGLPMFTKRIYADPVIQDAIIVAAKDFHEKLEKNKAEYELTVSDPFGRFIPTERKNYDMEISA